MFDDTAYVMLDTNTLLHFKRPDEIDWIALLGSRGVNLIVTPALVRELEEQKVKNRSKRLRTRAEALVRWIADYIESDALVEIRDGVRLIFVRHSPMLDFAAYRLSPAVSDDEFIAHAIEAKREYDRDVIFFTADTGLRLKLPAHDFKVVRPPDDLKLRVELDSTERENANLRAELSRHKDRLPRLALTFPDGTFNFSLPSMRLDIDKTEPEPPPDPWGMVRPGAYNEYLRDFNEWKAAARSSTGFRVCLENEGSAVATNISVVLTFPDFVLAKELLEPPKVPEFLSPPNLSNFPLGGEPLYSERHNTASFDLTDLVHNRADELGPVWLRFSEDKLIRNFSAEYEITCVEIVKPIRGRLHFTVEQWTALIKGYGESGT